MVFCHYSKHREELLIVSSGLLSYNVRQELILAEVFKAKVSLAVMTPAVPTPARFARPSIRVEGVCSCMSRNSTEFVGIPDQLYHWIPGEMVIIVRLLRLPPDDVQDTLVEQIRTLLNRFLAPYQIVLEPYGTYGRWSQIPAMPPVRRSSFIFGLHRKQPLIAIFFHARHNDPSVQDPSPMALSYLQGNLEQLAQAGLHVVSAMPNWTVMAAPLLYSNGGPAIPPRP